MQAERLNEAIDELAAGHGEARVSSGLPATLRPLVSAAASLLSRRGDSGPRPGFVLGLEEQLRADLRLGGPDAPDASDSPNASAPANIPLARQPAARLLLARAVAVVGVALALFALGALVADRVDPLDAPLRSSQTAPGAHDGAVALAERYLNRGWRQLMALASMPEPTAGDDLSGRRVLISAIVPTYVSALEAIEHAADSRLAMRAGSELRLARRLLTQTSAHDAQPMFVADASLAAAQLDDLIDRADALAARLVVAAGPSGGTAGGQVPPRTGATAGAAANATSTVAAAATSESISPPPTAQAAPSQTAVLPSVTPTGLGPSATPTAVVPAAGGTQPVRPEPTNVPPTAQPTQQAGPQPAIGTAFVLTPTSTPEAVKADSTATPDSWPVTSTPLPHTPVTPVVLTDYPGRLPTAHPPTPDPTDPLPPEPEPTTSGHRIRP